MFLQRFPNVPIQVHSTIMWLIDKFKDTANMADKQQLRRKKLATLRESMDRVQTAVSQHRHTSSHRIASTF